MYSNVQPQVANYLSFDKGVHCLHIGCGAGAFLMDMASEYPKSTFVGVDTVPMAEIVCGIPNISFVLGNVLDGLSLAENSFDYIQMRVLGNLLTRDQWPVALKEVYRLLKPGGCVGFFEYEPRVKIFLFLFSQNILLIHISCRKQEMMIVPEYLQLVCISKNNNIF